MKNWSIDEKYLKQFPEKYEIWILQQMINNRVDDGQKIDREDLIKYWEEVSPLLDNNRRKFMEFLLWNK